MSAGRYTPAQQYSPAGQYMPAEPSSAHPTQPVYGAAVRQAAFEEPASGQATAVRPGTADPAAAPGADRATTGGPAPGESAPLPVTVPGEQSSVRLPPPGESSQPGEQGRGTGPGSAVTVVGALGLVLGIFLLTAWGIRRAAPQSLHPLPAEVFEALGRAPLAGRQQAHLLRLGNKLVLVSLSPAGAETLTEITDPVEVDRVAGLCRQTQPGSATAVFRQVFEQFAPRRPSAREVGRTYGSPERPHG